MNRRRLYTIAAVPVALIAFLYLTVLFTPNAAIKGVLVRIAENAGYTLECDGFGKGFPLGLRSETVVLSGPKGTLLRLEKVRVGLNLLPLLAGRLRLSYRAGIGPGSIEGDLSLGKAHGWTVEGHGIRLEDIPYFSTVAAARIKGELKLDGRVTADRGQGKGELRLQVRGAELAGIKLGEMPLPDASYKDIRGALQFDQGRAVLKSFTLDGDGIYIRLKGDTIVAAPPGNSPLNLTMEMMPNPAFLERQKFVFLLLMKYQTSPGAYSIPIHGTLAHPAI